MPRPIPWDPPEPVACRTWEAARMLGVSDGTVLRLARVAAARDERSDRPCVLEISQVRAELQDLLAAALKLAQALGWR
jgi:hypothetical protein